MKISRFAFVLFAAASLAGCGVVYKVTVNQGNLLEKKDLDSVKPGMTKRQVLLVLGTPAVQSPFHEDRWDYTASISRRGKPATVRTLTLFFENNALVRMEGDYPSQAPEDLLDEATRLRGKAIDPLEELNAKRQREKQRRGAG